MRFADISGNDDLKRVLAGMADSGRIPHAMLFYENEGCGALPLLLAFYQYLCCTDRHDGDSCGRCPSCSKVSKLIHPDMHFVYPVNSGSKISSSAKPSSEAYLPYWRELCLANPYYLEGELYDALGIEGKSGNIAVSEAKFILDKLSLTSVQDGYKAVVVWLPEKMNAESGNKLLKIVEEPPEKTLFLFVTHAPERMLQTIFSRCQSLRVLPAPREEVASVLERQFSVSPDEASAYAGISCGSVGVALNHIGEREEYNVFMDLFADLVGAAMGKDLMAALEAAEEMAALDSREKQKAFCNFAGDCIRKIFMVRNNMPGVSNATRQELPFFAKVAGQCRETFCEKALGYFDKAAQLIDRNVNPKIVFCDLADRIFLCI
ncbi:MAG: hypothetical protein NC115_11130 [Bacteroidales bacterium]|nr:hypothetical protein [Bacteroidales bacterium]